MDADPSPSPLLHLFAAADMPAPRALPLAGGLAVVFAQRAPDKATPNEDTLGVLDAAERGAVLILADGAGGHAGGGEASRLAVTSLADSVREALAAERGLRDGILDGFEAANQAVAAGTAGGVTTLLVAELRDGRARVYHAGDSMALLAGLRGRLKHCSTPHSPTGYAVQAGVLEADDAMHHDERHLLSNALGAPGMHIEIGPALPVAARDTLVLGSDGLFDNLMVEEIVDRARRGAAVAATASLVELCHERMAGGGDAQLPSKPDDLSLLLWRPRTRADDAPVPPPVSPG